MPDRYPLPAAVSATAVAGVRDPMSAATAQVALAWIWAVVWLVLPGPAPRGPRWREPEPAPAVPGPGGDRGVRGRLRRLVRLRAGPAPPVRPTRRPAAGWALALCSAAVLAIAVTCCSAATAWPRSSTSRVHDGVPAAAAGQRVLGVLLILGGVTAGAVPGAGWGENDSVSSPSSSPRSPCRGVTQLRPAQPANSPAPAGDRPAGRRRRARPLRPRPARHPRPLADRGGGQGRARRPAVRRGPRPGRRPRSARSSALARAGARRRAQRRSPATATSPWPRELAGARAALAAAGHRGRRCPARSTNVPAGAARAVRLGRPGGRHERGAAQRGASLRDPGAPRPRSRSLTTAVARRTGPTRPETAQTAPVTAWGLRERAEAAGAVGRPSAARREGRLSAAGDACGDRPVSGPSRSASCSPTTRPWSAARWPRCSRSSPTWRSSPRSAGATRWSREARRVRPDVALLDVEMPGLDGIAATAALRAALPTCRVLVVTTFGRPGYLRRAMEAGASGFVVKDTPARQLADAVRRVHAGLRVVDPSLAAETLAAGDSPLTERETDVLRAARGGGTRRRPRPGVAPLRGDRTQPPVRGDRQDRRPYPGRSGPGRRAERLAARRVTVLALGAQAVGGGAASWSTTTTLLPGGPRRAVPADRCGSAGYSRSWCSRPARRRAARCAPRCARPAARTAPTPGRRAPNRGRRCPLRRRPPPAVGCGPG